jgi:hypothetical protein
MPGSNPDMEGAQFDFVTKGIGVLLFSVILSLGLSDVNEAKNRII